MRPEHGKRSGMVSVGSFGPSVQRIQSSFFRQLGRRAGFEFVIDLIRRRELVNGNERNNQKDYPFPNVTTN